MKVLGLHPLLFWGGNEMAKVARGRPASYDFIQTYLVNIL